MGSYVSIYEILLVSVFYSFSLMFAKFKHMLL